MDTTKFGWDQIKARTNVEKTGVAFETACLAFDRPRLTRTDDRRDYGEVREISIGTVGDGAYLVIVHTTRGANVRIISARPASTAERGHYEQALHPTPDTT